jgi:uncharacterized membrane protein
MSQTYSAALIALAAQILPLIGEQVGTDELTTTLSTILTILSGVWILRRRFRQGDIYVSGRRRA